MSETLCHTLDRYLDGDLPAAESSAFEAHTETCADCQADLAASRLIQAELSRLSGVTAPAGLVEAALQAASRSASDRQPVRSSRSRFGRFAGVMALGALLVALATAWMRMTDSAPAPTLQADAESIQESEPTATPAPEPLDVAEAALASELSPRQAPPAPRPAPAPRRQRVAPPPAPAPPTPSRPAPVDPPVELVENAVPPADSVAQAKQDLLLALALVADAQDRAGSTVSTEINRAAGAMTDTSVF